MKTVPRKVLDERRKARQPSGVMAHAKPYQYSSVTDILKIAERDAEKNNGAALVVLLGSHYRCGQSLAPSRVRLT